jgi:hypothetical protein
MSRYVYALVVPLASLPAFAAPVGPASTVTVGPSDFTGAIAEVTFTNSLEAAGTFIDVDLGNGLIAHFEMGHSDTPDRMTLTVPEGYVTVPSYVDVQEDGQGVIVIYSLEGVGM